MKEKIELKNLPDKIWIQVGEIDIDFDNDFKKLRESNEVTWCEHKIDNWDIEYTRSSLIESLINQEVEKRIAEKMPSERLREELIAYGKVVRSWGIAIPSDILECSIDEYLKSRDSHDTIR